MPRWCEETLLRAAVAVGLVTCAYTFSPSRAAAAEPEAPLLDLEWIAPTRSGCPTREEVVARVADVVGHVRSSKQRAISARGRVTENGRSAREPRYRLELVIIGSEANERILAGDDCSHLADAAALILALDIDPEALARSDRSDSSAPSGSPEPSTPRAAEVVAPASPPHAPSKPTPPAPARRAETPPPRPFHLHGGARLVLDDGSLPRPTLGAAAFIGIVRGPLVLETQLTTYNERFTVTGPRSGRGGAYVSLAAVEAHACLRPPLASGSRIDGRACLTVEVGLESTTGVSVTHPETARGLWSAAGLMIAGRLLPRSRVSPTAGLALAHPIHAPPVFIEGYGTVFEPPFLVVRCILGLDVLFF